MSLEDKFKNIIKNVALILKEHDYTRKRNTFYKRQDGNWGILNFQKSMANTKEQIRFTLNIGIASQTIRKFFNEEGSQKLPTVQGCQWKQRIGEYLPNGNDFWWSLNETTDSEFLFQEIKHVLVKQVLPTIDAHMSDDQLISLWLSGKGPGTMQRDRLTFLTVLYKMKGMNDQVAITLQKLEHEIKTADEKSWLKLFKRWLSNE